MGITVYAVSLSSETSYSRAGNASPIIPKGTNAKPSLAIIIRSERDAAVAVAVAVAAAAALEGCGKKNEQGERGRERKREGIL